MRINLFVIASRHTYDNPSCDQNQPSFVHQGFLAHVSSWPYGLHQLLTHVDVRIFKIIERGGEFKV